jgi:hypothetical protein
MISLGTGPIDQFGVKEFLEGMHPCQHTRADFRQNLYFLIGIDCAFSGLLVLREFICD